ncbi:MAG: V-type ATP synthase subunit F [Promethearchaeia archaeon]
MTELDIHVIGHDDIVLLLGIIGIRGSIVEKAENFLEKFNELTQDPKVGLIIIAINLPSDIMDTVINYKLTHRRPVIFYLPNLLQPNVEENDLFHRKIIKSVGEIVNK